MSRRDERAVADLMPDMGAIGKYFEAKGVAVPPWVYTAEARYHAGFLDTRILNMSARLLRPYLEQHPEAKDLEALFIRLVALSEAIERTDPGELGKQVFNRYKAALNQLKALEKKYSLVFGALILSEAEPLASWEKLPPGSASH